MTHTTRAVKNISVAIIVCTLDRPETTRWLVAYIDRLHGKLPPDISISLVLVESSRELTRIVNEPVNLDFHHLKSPGGLPHQRNVGVDFVMRSLPNAQVLAFLDDDVIPTTSFFESTLNIASDDNPRFIGAIDLLEKSSWQMELAESIRYVPQPGKISRSGFATAPRESSISDRLDWVSGFAFAMNRKVFHRFRFPEDVQFFGEDVLFGLAISAEVALSIPKSADVFHAPFGVKQRSQAEDHRHRYLLAYRISHLANRPYFHRVLFWLRVFGEYLVESIPSLFSKTFRMRFQGRSQALRELFQIPRKRRHLGG
jgi:GT2 family glycosyltransferase